MKVVVCHVKENNKYYMIKLNDISKSFKNKKALDKLSLECWDDKKVDLNTFNEYLKVLQSQ